MLNSIKKWVTWDGHEVSMWGLQQSVAVSARKGHCQWIEEGELAKRGPDIAPNRYGGTGKLPAILA